VIIISIATANFPNLTFSNMKNIFSFAGNNILNIYIEGINKNYK